MPLLKTTCEAMAEGVDASAGTGKTYRLVVGGTWATGDKWTVLVKELSIGFQFGAGDVTGIEPTFALTHKQKVYVLAGSKAYFCKIGDPTVWNDNSAPGRGFIALANTSSSPENLLAVAVYQGRLAFFTDKTVHIWEVGADPTTDNRSVQVLPNIGTLARLSVVNLGELDVFFLAYTGVRSLRVRDSSLNASVADLGSPIDLTLQPVLLNPLLTGLLAEACAVVEPSALRYWLFLVDTIYALSYFSSSKIVAWSTYLPTTIEAGVPTTFTPQKILSINSGGITVAFRTTNALVYTADKAVPYEATTLTVQTGFQHAGKPGTMKQFTGLDIVGSSGWTFYVATDPNNPQYVLITTTTPTFMGGRVAMSERGTHISIRATSSAVFRATLSSIIVHYEEEDAS